MRMALLTPSIWSAETVHDFSGAPKDDFLLNALKHFLGYPEYF